jgi:hypothetical protein
LRRFSDARTHFFADLMLGKKSSPLSIRREQSPQDCSTSGG